MKPLYPLCAVFSIVTVLAPALPAATYGGGAGTAGDPYQIWTAAQMNTIGVTSADWAASFKLMADLDMSIYTAAQYNIIGNTAKAFTGTFDGGAHTIRNLTYTSTAEVWYVGLFGRTGPGAVIRSLGLENVDISVAGYYAGGLVGDNSGTISKCYAMGSVTGLDRVGGLVAANSQGSIDSCFAIGDISGSRDVGGLVGENDAAITNCYARGTAVGSDSVGGLVGYNYNGTLTDCYAAGGVGSTSWVGGLVGYNDLGTATNCLWDLQASEDVPGAGTGALAGTYGKLTSQMQQRATFVAYNWDFVGSATSGAPETWRMCTDGSMYPQLNWVSIENGDFVCPDGTVKRLDLRRLAADWLMTYSSPLYGADANADSRVDFLDFAIMAAAWGQ